ncbi:mitogen-activated protein kinase kinase kinase [Saccharomyces pastorianus]|uniref:Mitogen-activated protein kinase kinase kinase n=1 Tax=Saccharomyces pastorianus TaxID=27292 RepID=A0A6C1EAZ6_SACPS|nr:mitogen-activated protein kinase kinase kinase [Saccharomyces pastorianus]
MPFLRKIAGTAHTHSRSDSSSSIKFGHQPTNSLGSTKSTSKSPRVTSRKSIYGDIKNQFPNAAPNSTSQLYETTPATEKSFNWTTDDHISATTVETPTSVTSTFYKSENRPGSFSDSRKSSGGNSVNSLSFDKLILSWDPTDPDEWTMNRVTSWFKFHDFPESWITFFKKHQLSGHRFIKLLAYENFAVYEKYLPQTKTASYTRFQQLLKKTMTKNVTNSHIRQKSASKLRGSRSSSESIKSKFKSSRSQEDISNSRSTSESELSPTKSGPSKTDEKNFLHSTQTHQKTKSASALYRRSFISLRGSSSTNDSSIKSPSNIKLSIPARPHSIIEPNNTLTKSASPPASPSYPSIFRRHHKSSSSESSLLNSLFGTGIGEEPSTRPNSQGHSISSENLAKVKTKHYETNVSSPLKQSSLYTSDDKGNLWNKFKRKSQIGAPSLNAAPNMTLQATPSLKSSSSTTTLTTQTTQTTQTSQTTQINELPVQSSSPSPSLISKNVNENLEAMSTEGVYERPSIAAPSRLGHDYYNSDEVIPQPAKSHPYSVKNFLLEQKFYPMKKTTFGGSDNKYVLVTKDNWHFVPVNLQNVTSLYSFKESALSKLGISHKNVTFHMTDFDCEIGAALPDDTLEFLKKILFLNTSEKIYVKDQTKLLQKSKSIAHNSENHAPLKSVKSKSSMRSGTSSLIASTDDVSIVTSSSDITSFDEHASGTGRRYPQTPSYYYDRVPNTSTNEELNYWNIKEVLSHEETAPKMVFKTSPKLELSLPDKANKLKIPTPITENESKSSFQVLRKDEGAEIDFNHRRESPYTKPELAPKREAPKPPTNTSPQRSLPSSKQNNTMRLMRASTKISRSKRSKPLPPQLLSSPVEASSSSPDSVTSSYTPASTHVLIPQPYKGANDAMRRLKTEQDSTSTSPSLKMKQKVNRSNSTVSTSNSIFYSPSPLLKRGNSKRVVSSTSAADIFEENDITFADAPPLSEDDDESDNNDSSSSDDIIWSKKKNGIEDKESKKDEKDDNDSTHSDEIFYDSEMQDTVERKMTFRPSPEVVYQNLEKFFPRANLDKPITEGIASPTSPKSLDSLLSTKSVTSPRTDPSTPSRPIPPDILNNSYELIQDSISNRNKSLNQTKAPKRTKTIRTIAHEASLARKKSVKLKRQNTKMWGTRMVEVTENHMVSINKAKNSKGEYKEFAWMKGEMIGKGSFGAVYLCLNVTTGEMMAVKQVEVPKYSSQNEAILSTVEALRSEVSTLKDLDHLNIVQYLGFENKNSIYSLFLEYVAGGSVGSLIRMYGRFDEPLIKHLTTQVLEGLAYLHSKGILHRDMKADNLLLDQDGICKISDFGISRKSKDIYSNSDMTMRGTVFWMAPEMVDTKQGYSAKVDIWSLGCIVLEMFAGKRPWSNLEVVAAMFKIGKSKSAPPIPEDTLPLITHVGRSFLDACFEIDPEKRPTATKLLSHKFSEVDVTFDFKSTRLAKFIKSNDKLNFSKLRITSQENKTA